jgi:hypothetical protein
MFGAGAVGLVTMSASFVFGSRLTWRALLLPSDRQLSRFNAIRAISVWLCLLGVALRLASKPLGALVFVWCSPNVSIWGAVGYVVVSMLCDRVLAHLGYGTNDIWYVWLATAAALLGGVVAHA